VEPLLADVAADPELVGAVAFPARTAEGFPVLPLVGNAAAFLCGGGWRLWLLHLRLG
jgi:hypothetical protein